MQIQTKYKSVFNKYRKFEIEKYNNISVEIQRSDRADHVDVCPDFDFFLQRLGLFMHTFDSKFRYMITIIIVAQNVPIHHQVGIQSGSHVFSPRRTCPEASPSSPSLFWTSTSTTPTRQLTSSFSMIRRMQRKLQQCGGGRKLSSGSTSLTKN